MQMSNALRQAVVGKTLLRVELVKPPKFSKRVEGEPSDLPVTVLDVSCKGKLCYLQFDNDQAMTISFGMTGSLAFNDYSEHKHNCLQLECSDGTLVTYRSQRHFGRICHLTTSELNRRLRDLGPSILDSSCLAHEDIVQRFQRFKRRNICVALMDQTLFSGIGNYIKSETLYLSKVNPNARVSELTEEQLYWLYCNARLTAQTAMSAAFDYQNKSNFLNVYGRTYDKEGRLVEKIGKTPDGRATFWVPELQISK